MSPHPLSSLHVTLAVHHTARASAQGVARSHTTCEGLASAVVCRGRGRRWPITTIPCRPPDVRILPASLRPSSPARRWPSRRAHEHAIVYHPPPSTRPILTAIHLAPCCPPSSPLPPPPALTAQHVRAIQSAHPSCHAVALPVPTLAAHHMHEARACVGLGRPPGAAGLDAEAPHLHAQGERRQHHGHPSRCLAACIPWLATEARTRACEQRASALASWPLTW